MKTKKIAKSVSNNKSSQSKVDKATSKLPQKSISIKKTPPKGSSKIVEAKKTKTIAKKIDSKKVVVKSKTVSKAVASIANKKSNTVVGKIATKKSTANGTKPKLVATKSKSVEKKPIEKNILKKNSGNKQNLSKKDGSKSKGIVKKLDLTKNKTKVNPKKIIIAKKGKSKVITSKSLVTKPLKSTTNTKKTIQKVAVPSKLQNKKNAVPPTKKKPVVDKKVLSAKKLKEIKKAVVIKDIKISKEKEKEKGKTIHNTGLSNNKSTLYNKSKLQKGNAVASKKGIPVPSKATLLKKKTEIKDTKKNIKKEVELNLPLPEKKEPNIKEKKKPKKEKIIIQKLEIKKQSAKERNKNQGSTPIHRELWKPDFNNHSPGSDMYTFVNLNKPEPIKIESVDTKGYPAKIETKKADAKKTALKTALKNKCLEILNKSVSISKKEMEDAQESANEEKGSTEEKFDSFRESMQTARDMHARQYAEAINSVITVNKIIVTQEQNVVILGSVVKTDLKNYFVSVSLGELEVDKEHYIAISIQTPLCQAIFGKKKGDTFKLMNKTYTIKEIF